MTDTIALAEPESIHVKPEVSPQARRERLLERRVNWLLIFVGIQFLGIILLSFTFVYRPQTPIVIDRETGQIVGDYRTSTFRTQEEMINGGYRFVDHLLSLNSSTFRRDQFIAMTMMSDSLRSKRVEWLEKTNLIPKVESANSTSHLEYEKPVVIFAKGDMLRVEFKGKIILTNLKKPGSPFHIIVDLVNTIITKENTSGVKVEAYNDF